MITLIHPSRGRANKAWDTIKYWRSKASGSIEIEHILSIDNDDPQRERYLFSFKESKIITGDNKDVVQATNRASKYATGDILIYLSDDFKCPNSWDSLIIDEVLKFGGKFNNSLSGNYYSFMNVGEKEWLLKVDDCLQKFNIPVLTIPVMSKKLYQKLGYFWHPGYKSMFVDEDLYWVCKKNNWLIEAPDLRFPHEHCANGKAENDETYKRSAANWNQGKALFAQRKAAGFPI